MRNAIWLLLGPAICLVVLVLTTLIVVFAMRRGTRTVQDALERREKGDQPPVQEARSADTRWARGDLKSPPQPPRRDPRMVSCPECGGENPAGTAECVYCGRKL